MRIARVMVVLLGVLLLAGATISYAQMPKAAIIMKDAPNGAVTFDHPAHVKAAGAKCVTCHHASRPEKPATAPQQACRNCHTKDATPPMKTKRQAAFHNPLAKAGTCIDCHAKLVAEGKTAPTKCTDCHKKAG
jgi:hypothetical protein